MKADEDSLKALEPLRVVLLADVARLLGITVETLTRAHGDKIIQISPRRRGMRVRDIRAIVEIDEKKKTA